MSAFYNEIDPFAAAWLRELIAAGHIAPGIVDERDIRDIRPADLAGFVQCHFFAGIGVWSYALRYKGVPDDFPIWTASCPCPPFSSAGPNFRCPLCDTRSPVPNAVRTGAFDCIRCGHEWQADERHLFPELFRLIRECGPELVVGEQVASNDGRTWLDVVSASLEMLGYAVGSPDTCAAGFGAPHIRQRLYWVADAENLGHEWSGAARNWRDGPQNRCATFGMGHAEQPRLERQPRYGDDGHQSGRFDADEAGDNGRLAHSNGGNASAEREQPGGEQRQLAPDGGARRLGDSDSDIERRGSGEEGSAAREGQGEMGGSLGEWLRPVLCGAGETLRPGPTNSLWRDVDWLGCTDGKWRPVEPGTFPLADAGAFRNRVGELRGAGNAVNLAQAAAFIEAVIDHLAEASERLCAWPGATT